jgi:hypothetical protein
MHRLDARVALIEGEVLDITAPRGGLWTVTTVHECPGPTAVPGLDGIDVDLTGVV